MAKAVSNKRVFSHENCSVCFLKWRDYLNLERNCNGLETNLCEKKVRTV